ncbi:MAG: DUF935 domain-containing protein [Peptococcaceae bacterium]|nr:DUF935 domain-containing protein [Peptococcaceae bacterium]
MAVQGIVRRRPAGRPPAGEVLIAPLGEKYSEYPSNGLTPVRLAEIFREADAGDVLRQMELFGEMEEKDPHLFSQLQTRKQAVTGLDYELLPFSDDPLDKAIAEFCSEQMAALEGMEEILMDLLDAIGKGISVSEIIWGTDGRHTVIREICHRHPKSFFWDAEDNFRARTRAEPAGILLPENKVIIHRYKAKSGHPARAGILRVCAWMYLFKNYSIKDWVAFAEVYGMPLRLGEYNPGASEAEKTALMRALIQIGSDAAGIIPTGTKINFVEGQKNSSMNIYEPLARYCDEQISKAVLGQTLTSDAGGGSYAQSKTHNEVRHDLTVADCRALASTLRRDLLKPLVMFNFGETVRIPKIRFDCEEAGDQKEQADIYSILINDLGMQVPVSHLRKVFAVPQGEAGEEVAVGRTNAFLPASAALKQQLPAGLLRLKAEAAETQELQKAQRQEDALEDAAIAASSPAWETLYQPLLALAKQTDSLEKLQAILEDPRQLADLLAKMDQGQLEQLLANGMLYGDISGRALEDKDDG